METDRLEQIKAQAMDITAENPHLEDDDENIHMEELEFDNQIDFEKATVENVIFFFRSFRINLFFSLSKKMKEEEFLFHLID